MLPCNETAFTYCLRNITKHCDNVILNITIYKFKKKRVEKRQDATQELFEHFISSSVYIVTLSVSDLF